jgi:hypothetical protein
MEQQNLYLYIYCSDFGNTVLRSTKHTQAKTEYRNKLTSQLMDKSIPPDKWWRIAKSVCKLNNCNKVSPPIKHEGRIIITVYHLV